MLTDVFQQANQLVTDIQIHLPITLNLLALMWGMHLINFALGYRLTILGIYPRHIVGLIGIIFAPFLHANFNHIFFNSIPLFVLANLVLLSGVTSFIVVSLIIIFCSGFMVWLVGRKALHVGASALVMGYWGYLLMNAIHQSTIVTILLGFVSIFYFGSLLAYLLPAGKGESWEGHVAGFVAGIIAVYLTPWAMQYYL
ncbi:MAG: rhomboid family intramembrane serine protease [Legionellales bacterium]|nr:rhomboid family intramembrane serine protease [Legionellales bacterium]